MEDLTEITKEEMTYCVDDRLTLLGWENTGADDLGAHRWDCSTKLLWEATSQAPAAPFMRTINSLSCYYRNSS